MLIGCVMSFLDFLIYVLQYLINSCFMHYPLKLGLTPRATGSGLPAQKLLARSLVGPENFAPICPMVQKLQHFF